MQKGRRAQQQKAQPVDENLRELRGFAVDIKQQPKQKE